MRQLSTRVIPLALCVFLLAACAESRHRAVEGATYAADDRAALVIPDALWNALLDELDVVSDRASDGASEGPRIGNRIGYSADQMRNFGRDIHLLRTVELLFRDVRDVPRFAGRVGDDFLEHAADPAETLRHAWLLTDVSAGRNLRAALGQEPEAIGWGVTWAPATAPSSETSFEEESISVIRAAVNEMRSFFDATIMVEPDLEGLASMPVPVQQLTARLAIAVTEGARWVWTAYDRDTIRQAVAADAAEAAARDGTNDWANDRASDGTVTTEALHRFLTRPWNDRYANQVATLSPASLALLDTVDRDAMAYASAIVATHVNLALEAFLPWATSEEGAAELAAINRAGTRFWTPLGDFRIAGPGDDEHHEPFTVLVDLGGNDLYSGAHATTDLDRPVAILIDVAGDDRYDGTMVDGSMACGMLGVAMLIDVAGDDIYRVRDSGLGRGLYGAALLLDMAGDDTYFGERWTQGAAHAGVGVLVDLEGDDRYSCAQQSQGLGGTLGAGVLVDVKGDDRYVARDDGNPSALYLGQSVAMSQGVGYGRRADLGDGRSLAGGVGALIDGAGDDTYHAQVWAQGAGYWWGLGILEDRGGNDRYRNGKYSLGAAAHFAIGCAVDLSGDDEYNIGNRTAVNQFQGHARDGSIGVFIDGGGNDRYLFRNHCGGSADLNSIALFWDRDGDDEYTYWPNDFGPDNGWNDTPPFGTTTRYEPFRTFRDDMPAIGIFLDTGGTDRFPRGFGRELDERSADGVISGGRWWLTPSGKSGTGIGFRVVPRR